MVKGVHNTENTILEKALEEGRTSDNIYHVI